MPDALVSFLQLFSFSFAQIALVATLLIALICGLLSPVVVLKQRAYLGDTLSHLVFPGVVVGLLLARASDIPLGACVLAGATVTALFGSFLSEWILKTLRIPPDAAAVVCLTAFFAIGIIVISGEQGTRINPESILFGDVLTLSWSDNVSLAATCALTFFLIFYLKSHWNAWLSDSEFAKIAGFKTRLLDRIFPVLVTLAVLSGLFAVGGLMIAALLTLPTLLTEPRSVFSLKTIFVSVGFACVGFACAFVFNWPVGPSLVLVGFFSLLLKAFVLQIQRKH